MGPVVTRDGRLDTPDHDVMAFFTLVFELFLFSFDGIVEAKQTTFEFSDKKH